MSAGDENASDGGNANPTAPVNDYEQTIADENEVFMEGLAALRRERPEAHVAQLHGNHAFVYLGVFDLSAYDGYDQNEVEAYIRVPKQFPQGDPYGFVTVPPLELSNTTETLIAQDVNHSNGQPITSVIDGDEFGWWSFRWQCVRVDEGSDLAKAVELVRSHIRNWEDNDGD